MGWLAGRRSFGKHLLGGECIKCGHTGRLEFDHINPKEKNSHKFWSWKMTRLMDELKKCQLLCHPCHQKKSADTYPTYKINVKIHGNYGFQQGCRCTVCREAQRKRRIRDRDRKR